MADDTEWENPNEEEDSDDDDFPYPTRRARGFLATDVDIICRSFAAGEFSLEEAVFLTPYIVGRILKERDDLEKQPSPGAVTAVFKRWQVMGYARFRQTPFAFIEFVNPEVSLQEALDQKKAKRASKK